MRSIYHRNTGRSQYSLGIKFCFLSLLLFTLANLSACGGGSGGSGDKSAGITVSGVVQKGTFTKLTVSAFPIDSVSGERGEPVITKSSNSNYSLKVPSEGFYELEAGGIFIHELTGEETTLSEPLKSVIETTKLKETSNINLYTHLKAEQALKKIKAGKTPDIALTEANTFVRQSLGFDESVELDQIDLTKIETGSTLTDPNLQLLLFSATALRVVKVLVSGRCMAGSPV